MAEGEAVNEVLKSVEARYGFVPNLLREMSRSPAALRVYLDGQAAIAGSRLTPAERQLVQLAVSIYNECEYCRAAHRTGCHTAGIAPSEIELVEKGALPEDRRRRALVSAAWQVLDMRGFLAPTDLASLEAEGVDRGQLYEVVALIALKTLSNYVNHIAHTPVDEAFRD